MPDESQHPSARNYLGELSAHFDPKTISKNPRGYHYIQIDEVYNRLDEVLGGDWALHVTGTKMETVDPAWKTYGKADKTAFLATVTVRITAMAQGLQTTRDGVGADFADDPDKAIKTALANAVKKAANGFGVGRYLWKAEERAAIDEANEARQNVTALKKQVVNLYSKLEGNEEIHKLAPSEKLDALASKFGVAKEDLASAETLNSILEANAQQQ